jgi:hypothetical protein
MDAAIVDHGIQPSKQCSNLGKPTCCNNVQEEAAMPKTITLLLSSMVPVGAWAAASANMGPSRLIIQVICAVVASFIIFIGILRATERNSWSRHRAVRRTRNTPALALKPPLPLQPQQPSSWRRFERDTKRATATQRGGLSA